MAIGVSSIIRFKNFHRFRDQMILNVSYFEVLAVDPGSVVAIPSYLAKGWGVKWFEALAGNFNVGLAFDRVELDEVNGVDIGNYAYVNDETGVVPGEALPVQDAVSVQFLRGDRTTRHGWKRFGGVPETFQAGGELTSGAITQWTTDMQTLYFPTLSPIVNVDLIDPGDDAIGSVGLRAIIWGGNSPAFPMGRYQPIEGILVKPNVSTQNTRKVGRGS
jgi:hypothetical protein